MGPAAPSGHPPTTSCSSLLGASLFTLKHDPWLPRRRALQPVFTKHNVRAFGGQITQAADMVAASWRDGQHVDLDAECRRLTLRALGNSVLGIDLDERADAIAEPLRTALGYVTSRITSFVKPPRWLPTPARGEPVPRPPPCADWPQRSCRPAATTRPTTPLWSGR